MRKQRVGFWSKAWKALRMRSAIPCVGLIVLAGSLTIIVAPDDEPSLDSLLPASTSFPTVIIDPGHGGNDDGARVRGLVEKRLTLDVSLRIEKLLKQYNFPVVLTRRDDSYVGLAQRAAIANKIEHSIFVSIHFNQSFSVQSSGIETFYATEKVAPEAEWNWMGVFSKPTPPGTDNGENLAGYIQAALILRTDLPNRGIRPRPLHVVRHTRSPAVLVECGFMSNAMEARLMANESYRELLARAVAEGILTFQKSRPLPAEIPPQLARALR